MNEDETDTVLVSDCSAGSRKRKITGGKRAAAKKKRYSAPCSVNVYTPCSSHTSTNKILLCHKLTPNMVKEIRDKFFSIPNKQRQDGMIANMIEVATDIKRRRPRPINKNKKQKAGGLHKYTVKYFLKSKKMTLRVCRKLFLNILKVGRTRVQNISNAKFEGNSIEEKRGGDRKSHQSTEKRNSVRTFIGRLRGTESHYNRNKSRRIYLSCDLSIKKLHKLYNESTEPTHKVHFAMFYRIFVNEFNIGFRSPASDTCSRCTFLTNKIKEFQQGSAERNKYMIEKRVHKQRANAFYKLLKTVVPNSVSYCFDLQQIQSLPKTPIQDAFYARQFNFYSLCVTDLECAKPIFYTWTEEQAGKGSLEISSALLNFLQNTDFQEKSLLRFFSDGCVAQNKNNIVLRTAMYFLYTHETCIQEIQFHFPVRGHSYLPADRVFGRVEKILRGKQFILTKDEYYDVYSQIGNVKKCGTDWVIRDTKELQKYWNDLTMISEMKRIYIKLTTRGRQRFVKVKGLENFVFESDEEFQSLTKRNINNRRLQRIRLNDVPLEHGITNEKKADVNKLLCAMFGDGWQDLNDHRFEWYKHIVFSTPTATETQEVEETCDCLEEEVAVRI